MELIRFTFITDLIFKGGTKRKAEEKEGEEVAVRKSTRIKQISELRFLRLYTRLLVVFINGQQR